MEKVGKLIEQLRTDHANEKAHGIGIENFVEFKVTLMDEMKATKEARRDLKKKMKATTTDEGKEVYKDLNETMKATIMGEVKEARGTATHKFEQKNATLEMDCRAGNRCFRILCKEERLALQTRGLIDRLLLELVADFNSSWPGEATFCLREIVCTEQNHLPSTR